MTTGTISKSSAKNKNKMKEKLAKGRYKIKGGDTRSFLYSIQSREEQGRMMAGIKAWEQLEEMESRLQVKNWSLVGAVTLYLL